MRLNGAAADFFLTSLSHNKNLVYISFFGNKNAGLSFKEKAVNNLCLRVVIEELWKIV